MVSCTYAVLHLTTEDKYRVLHITFIFKCVFSVQICNFASYLLEDQVHFILSKPMAQKHLFSKFSQIPSFAFRGLKFKISLLLEDFLAANGLIASHVLSNAFAVEKRFAVQSCSFIHKAIFISIIYFNH